jgi:hypothetical protein
MIISIVGLPKAGKTVTAALLADAIGGRYLALQPMGSDWIPVLAEKIRNQTMLVIDVDNTMWLDHERLLMDPALRPHKKVLVDLRCSLKAYARRFPLDVDNAHFTSEMNRSITPIADLIVATSRRSPGAVVDVILTHLGYD